MQKFLSAKQCKNLFKWGLPQDPYNTHLGEWWWYGDWGGTLHPQLIEPDSIEWFPAGAEVYKIPDLAELVEFAQTLTDKWLLSPHRGGWQVMKVTSLATFIDESGWVKKHHVQAAYCLIENYFKEKKKYET